MIAPNESQEPPLSAAPAVPNEFRVRLEDVFSGPLDLLLHLVREHEVEITEVSLARVCSEFLRHVRDLAEIDLGLAGDYLVVAATLVAVKSRALVPSGGEEVELEEEIDPGDDLVRRLLQYRRVREASRNLDLAASRRAACFDRGEHEMPPRAPGEFDLSEVGPWEILAAFAKVLRATGGAKRGHRIGMPARRIAEYAAEIATRLRVARDVAFHALFPRDLDRADVIGYFLAILELSKQGAIRARQTGAFGEIRIERTVDDLTRFDALVSGLADPEAMLAETEWSGSETGPETTPEGVPSSTAPEAAVIVRALSESPEDPASTPSETEPPNDGRGSH